MSSEQQVIWLAEYRENGVVAFRVGSRAGEVIAEWIGIARLVARRDGSQFSLEPQPGADADELEKIEKGSAVLLLRHLQGKLAMHGAVVGLGGRAVALVGRSGQGKSTLAAALCADGTTLFADDAIALDPDADGSWLVMPTEVNHWLDAASRKVLGDPDADGWEGKWASRARAVAHGPARLAAVVELAFDDEVDAPALVRTTGIEAMASLVPQTIRFALDDEERHKEELGALSRLVTGTPIYRLVRRRDITLLRASVHLIQKLLQGTSP